MWKIQYTEYYKDEAIEPCKVNIQLKNNELNIQFQIDYKLLLSFFKLGFLYFDNGEYDITIDKKKDEVSIGVNKGEKYGYYMYNYKNGGKEIYNYLKKIKENNDKPKMKKYYY